MIIYKITNLINNKIYIGKDSHNNPNYYGSGIVIKLAIKKYGKENFKKETIDTAENFEELNKKEIFWIKEYQSYKKEIGYNRSYGGDGFSGILPETSEKIRLKNTGKKRSDESRKKMSLSSINIPKSEEHKKSLSKAWEKRKIEKPFTKETLEKMKTSMIGKNKGKYVNVYELRGPDGKIYTTNQGISIFAKSIHKHPNQFKKLVEGKRKEYGGWTYIKTIKEYKNDNK